MPSLFTLQSIDETLANMDLKPGTLKADLARTIRGYFSDDSSLQSIVGIPADELILKIWGPCSDEELKAKRKNFSSLKSAINKSLKELDRTGKNPAGIVLGRDNVFTVSQERKDDLLKQLGLSADSPHLLRDMLHAFKKLFSETIEARTNPEVKDFLAELESTRKMLEEIAGIEAQGSPSLPEDHLDEKTGDFEIQEIELAGDEELRIIEDDGSLQDLPTETGPATEEDGAETEEIELAEDEELQFLEDDGSLQDVPTETGPATEEDGAETEEIELAEDEELRILAEDESFQNVPAATEPATEEEGAEIEEIELAEDEELRILAEDESFQNVPATTEPATEEEGAEIEEIELAEDEELRILAEDESFQNVPATTEPATEEEGAETEEIELAEDEELRILAEDESLQDVPTETGSATEEDGAKIEEIELTEDEELRILAEDESFQDVPATTEPATEEEGAETEEIELAEDEELRILEDDGSFLDLPATTEPATEEEEAETEEIELAEDEELRVMGKNASVLPPGETPPQPGTLEILSKYIESDDALDKERELLRETREEFIQQILDRFMPKFIRIPAGRYIVGSSRPTSLEQMERRVSLGDFYLGQTPVTNDLFDLFIRETGYVTDAEKAGYGIVYEGRCTSRVDPASGRKILTLTHGTTARHISGANWRHPAGPGSSLEGKHDHPVVQVSHDDARAFAAWAGKRLPTEEEWEAAARGPDGLLFPWGNTWHADRGNFAAACLGSTTPVDHFGHAAMSPFGIRDLLGNVAEWTATPHRKKNGPQPPASIYVVKGGDWAAEGIITAAQRRIERSRHWTNTIGFRCAV